MFNALKKLVYPALMFIEMAAKNFTLDQMVPGMKDTSIDNIYKTKMNDELRRKFSDCAEARRMQKAYINMQKILILGYRQDGLRIKA